ncbi:MAG: hypothetical protein WC907_01410 [Acholeplasmataceae bacterium]
MKALSNLKRLQVSSDYLISLIKVYENKGKEFYYDKLFKTDEEVLKVKTSEENTFYLGKILNLELTDARLRLLSRRNNKPKNKDEALLVNIKSALSSIQRNPKGFEYLENEFDNLAKMLSKKYEQITFNKREVKDNKDLFNSSKMVSKRDDLTNILNEFKIQQKTNQYELIQLVTNFLIDYLESDIFTSDNDIISLIILYAIIIKEFSVFKYIPFFELLYKSYSHYQKALNEAKYYYDTGFPNTDSLSIFLVNILSDAYNRLDRLGSQYSFEKTMNKSDSIEATILKGKEIFSKNDLRLKHPTVSVVTIDRTLARLKDEGVIRLIGKGRSAKWQKIDEKERKGIKQLDIFYFTE